MTAYEFSDIVLVALSLTWVVYLYLTKVVYA